MAKSSFKDLISSEKPVLIDFYADWCGPCKTMSPIIQELKSELGGKARILKIDVDRNPQLSGKLGVQSIPTIMLYQNGELKWRANGVQRLHTLKAQIEALL